MRSVETEAASIDAAIARALDLLHVERDRVEVEILENSSKGLLGFGGKRARIRATVRAPLVIADVPESAGADVSLETAPEPTAARQVLEAILSALGLTCDISVSDPVEGVWTFAVRGQDSGIAIGRHGQTLDAIEYLMNRVLGQGGKILLDVEGYRERRQESLEETAHQLAAKVRETGRPAALSPMNARERRIVHLALSSESAVTTHSQGEGPFRHVVIAPAHGGGRRPSFPSQ